jgi:hypothetical protein
MSAEIGIVVPKIVLYVVMLVFILALCIAIGIFRKMRGGTFLPARDPADDAPQSLGEMSALRRAERQKKKNRS